MKLSAIQVKLAETRDKSYKLSDGHGLFILINPNGTKYWRMKYRFSGKEKLMAFGVYPEISLAAARAKRQEAKKILDMGIDPAQKKKKEQTEIAELAAKQQETFKKLGENWLEVKQSEWSQKHFDKVCLRLNKHVFPYLNDKHISEIKPKELLEVLNKIERQGAFETAHRCLQYINAIFIYAAALDIVETNPASLLKGVLKAVNTKNHAALHINDFQAFWHKLEYNDARMYEPTRIGLMLMPYVFVRPGELLNAQWSEIDFDNNQWCIPKERMKMKREHIVPLSSQASALLKKLYNITRDQPYVFPSPFRRDQVISDGAFRMALNRMGYKGKMTVHGFRAMASTNMYEREFSASEVIEKQLAHEEANKVKAAYNRAQYLEQRTKLMQDWADFLDYTIENGNPPDLLNK